MSNVEGYLRQLQQRISELEDRVKTLEDRPNGYNNASSATSTTIIESKSKAKSEDLDPEEVREKYRKIISDLLRKYDYASHEKDEVNHDLKTTIYMNQMHQEKIERLDKFMNDISAQLKSYGYYDTVPVNLTRPIEYMVAYCMNRNIVPTDIVM
jgi:hypothetical protein